MSLLSLPAGLQVGSGGFTDNETFLLGFRPKWKLYADGREIWNSVVQTTVASDSGDSSYDAVLARADVELGIDMVQTATLDLVGDEAAVFAQEYLKKGTKLEVDVGYDDVGATFNRARRIFSGNVVQGFPPSGYPVKVKIQADSGSYKLRDARGMDVTADSVTGDFLGQQIAMQGLTSNLVGFTTGQLGAGGSQGTSKRSLLDAINTWSRENGLHWIDNMDGSIFFLFPRDRYNFMGSTPKNWQIPLRKTDDPELAPILKEWAITVNTVATPETVEGVWYAPGSHNATPVVIAENVSGGEPETRYSFGHIPTQTQEEAKAVIQGLAQDFLWQSVEGSFTLAAGLPILPYDDLMATHGIRGLEDIYDVYMRCYKVHHIYDARGWSVRGRVRGILP